MLHSTVTFESNIQESPHDTVTAIVRKELSKKELLKLLLEEQKTLTAVEEFSQQHFNGSLPAQSKYYSSLIPASSPEEGQQYAFEVDLDRCSGCKACVSACHSLNGLDEKETWRDVGLLVGGTNQKPVMQHVTTACHHCLEPGCMSACPVDAYEKDPVTGIVKHLDDQCFGCQYCTLACPYDVPKYHSEKGVVRKCDMCSDRLKVGEAPACVQACPHEAISINIVDIHQVVEDCETNTFLPGAPDPHLTLPTTTYKSKNVFPRNMIPADHYSAHPEHAHWPLVVMLVLTQLSVGAFIVGFLLERFLASEMVDLFRPYHSVTALGIGLLALVSSTFHLGRPQFAYRAFIGLRHSWLSREIVTFGLFAKLAILYAAHAWLSPIYFPQYMNWSNTIAWGVMISGVSGVFCSMMIYVFTKRVFWSVSFTGTKFFMTSLILGLAACRLLLTLIAFTSSEPAMTDFLYRASPIIDTSLLAAMAVKLVFEGSLLFHLRSRQVTSLKRTALLMTRQLLTATMLRFSFGILGGCFLPLLLIMNHTPEQTGSGLALIIASIMFGVATMGELFERYLYFAAVAPSRMPGGFRS
ncbi:Anaerobic dimethyl sulfoxide reductase chain B [Polystyrenella longa]|uniref:Anaerobic dimethyl sulfoxide reductase chain B n=1 Tax=Polystyrenella longa TaxID=2528007 RepID=A0A518CSY6_9PLAN|nr:DmsC/YnfH family molybdoenzyme membrane anchor subunit [Polystyrenella longa]QDU82343.1 Anaerobic dimethyl sulfoxide reductase chain B [Polystyrenella longa]